MDSEYKRIYNIWADMKKRCNKTNRAGYQNYGGRGITYSASWETFEGFCKDMLALYKDNLTLERKDVNGNYDKDNCEWVEQKEQALNKTGYRNNKLGIPNMKIINNKGVETLQVRIQNPSNGKRVNKWYSLNLYSLEKAIELASIWLKDKRSEFGYKLSHGALK